MRLQQGHLADQVAAAEGGDVPATLGHLGHAVDHDHELVPEAAFTHEDPPGLDLQPRQLPRDDCQLGPAGLAKTGPAPADRP